MCVMVALLVFVQILDNSLSVSASQGQSIRVIVTDINDRAVHNALVTVESHDGFYTDNNGYSPVIRLDGVENSYDKSITDWYTVTVTVSIEGYVDTVVLNCVVYAQQTRTLNVRIYPVDSSELSVVCYVESPPDSYLQSLFAK